MKKITILVVLMFCCLVGCQDKEAGLPSDKK